MSNPTYPTEGARISAETGKTKRQIVLEEATDIPREHWTAVGLLANFISNTSRGYRPSDAMRVAIRHYRANPEEVLDRNKFPR